MPDLTNKHRAGRVAILGVFVADAAYRATRQPKMGETILGSSFALGPGGKGSNQAVAAARCGADVSFITRLGQDAFSDMALKLYEVEGISTHIEHLNDSYTGSAYIFIDENTGDNAIIVCPGAASTITPEFVEGARSVIEGADVFVTQLEQPGDAAVRALEIAQQAGVTTILNTAPAEPIDDAVFKLCDYLTPNETEVENYTGINVVTLDDARKAGDVLLRKGVGTALITLGKQGALLHNKDQSVHIPAVQAGNVVETTGAGDAFNGGFATALAQGMTPVAAAHFACAVAGISVTRAGTAPSMPSRAEVDALVN
ncbi:MAG: ribokinase [Granulosicoccus sp.]|jgi:ribokinase